MRAVLLAMLAAAISVLCGSGLGLNLASAADGERVDYTRDVKPIFIKHCAACHGGLKQSGGLRLDTAAAMRRGGDSGPAVVPGKTGESLLVEVLRGEAGFTMPPEGQGTPPSAAQRALIVRWIKQGAAAPRDEQPQADPKTYWSYQPLTARTVPQVNRHDWVRNPIDAFVADEQQARQLVPQPPAAPAVLLRRLYLDLVGYPPTREELRRFLADPGDAAYEAVVDELLARPQYGERWGRHWMDVWRYSDWYGRRPSNEIRYSQRHIWRWRDWIIRSLNEDKGYDRMITEMLAGDEVAPLDRDTLAATGFLGRNWYKFDKNTWLFETVEQTSRGLLAMTMQCCRCHDHKYDPVAQLEYYRFRAFFEPHGFRTDPVAVDTATEVDNGKSQVLRDGLSRAYDEQLDVPTFLFQRGDDRSPDKEHPLKPGVPASLGAEGLTIRPVALPVESYFPAINPLAIERVKQNGRRELAKVDRAREQIVAQLTRLREQLAGLKPNSNTKVVQPFVADEFEKIDPARWQVVSGKWTAKNGKLTESQVTSFATLVSKADHPRNFVAKVRYRKLQPGTYRSVGFSFDYRNNGRDSQDVYTSRTDGRPHGNVQAFHRIGGKQTYPAAGIRPADISVGKWIDLEFTVRESQLTITVDGTIKLEYDLPIERAAGKFSIWVHQGSAEFERLSITPLVPTAAAVEAAITAAEYQLRVTELAAEEATVKADFAEQQIRAERLRLGVDAGDAAKAARQAHATELRIAEVKARQAVVAAHRQVALADNGANQQKLAAAQTSLQAATAAVDKADGGYTQLKSQFPTSSSGRRLALARWLTRPDHPRTARVAVNHIWLRHFGSALVASTDNFGLSGKRPSHPPLLDWLAHELVTNHWSMKRLHKLIVMSSTYRLASGNSKVHAANRRRDPNNVYLWRANSRRMEAEVVRDSILSAAGELDETTGGPDLDEKLGQTSRRRSLYFRTTPDNQMPMLAFFDQANPDECYRRRESVIPQQALALMNGPLALDLSRTLAAKLHKQLSKSTDDDTTDAFIAAAFETILSRPPTSPERVDCREFLAETVKLLERGKNLAPFPATTSQPKIPPSSDPRQRARENLVHVLFNHNEFVTIR